MSEQAWVVMRQDTSDNRILDLVHVDNVEERARLIAAAPDLLEACKTLVAELQKASFYGRGDQSFWDAEDAMRTAIAKAEAKP
jgi:hypothetical protein